MLTLKFPETESYNESTHEFIIFPAAELKMEHTLRAIADWEGRTYKSFFDTNDMTTEDIREYARSMTLEDPGDPNVYSRIGNAEIAQIVSYMNDPKSAKQHRNQKSKKPPKNLNVTAENVYAAMFRNGIPMECENWHFNRLMALIRTCDSANGGEKPMTRAEERKYWNHLNEERRKKWNTKG